MITVELPIKTINTLNGTHAHWRTVAAMRKKQRALTFQLIWSKSAQQLFLPATVTLTRLSAGELDDDGLRAALKSVRDGVADAFLTDDSAKSGLTFHYAQERCKRGVYGVRVTIGEG